MESINIKIGEENVESHYPSVQEKLMIEGLKMSLSNNMYGDLSRSSHISGNAILDFIDAYAYLSVCCPSLELNKQGFDKISPLLQKTLILAFKEHFYPWYLDIEINLAAQVVKAYGTEANESNEEDDIEKDDLADIKEE